jgi:hypothetical protein
MTPNILDAMKFPFNVGDYTWIDLQEFDKTADAEDVQSKATELNLPELLHDNFLPKELPMPFEKFGVAHKTKKGVVLATTYERVDNTLTVTLRIAARPFLCWFRHHGDIRPPTPNLEFDMEETASAKLMDAVKNHPSAVAAGIRTEEDVMHDLIDGVRNLYLKVLINMMEATPTTPLSAYTPVPNPANEKRVRKGKRPIFEWKVIDVTAKRTIPTGATGKTHASPRRHKRRGHMRKYKNGKTVWIKEMMVGKIEFGYIHHSYTTASQQTH